MFLKKTYFLSLAATMLLSGCVLNQQQTEPPIKAQNLNETTAIDTDFISGINANDLQKRINARYIDKVMKVYGLNTKEEAIEQIIEIESNYQFRQLLEKKGIHKAMNSDKVSVMALEENSYQLEKSKIEEKKLDGTIKTVIETKKDGISVKRSILNQSQSDNVAETKGALQALNTVEAKEVELIDNSKTTVAKPELKTNMKVELIPENQNLKNEKVEVKKTEVAKAVEPVKENEPLKEAIDSIKTVEPAKEDTRTEADIKNEIKNVPEAKQEIVVSKNTLVLDNSPKEKSHKK